MNMQVLARPPRRRDPFALPLASTPIGRVTAVSTCREFQMPGEWPDLAEPGHLADPDPAGPDCHGGGRGQDQQRPRTHGPTSLPGHGGSVRTSIVRWSGPVPGLVRGPMRPVTIACGVNLLRVAVFPRAPGRLWPW